MEISFFGITLELGGLTGEAGKLLKETWQQFHWTEAEENYRNRLIYLYGTLRILGNPAPVPLEGVFTDVYILDKPSAFRRFDIQDMECDWENTREQGMQRQHGLEVVNQIKHNRLFILGKPGAGKTTFLKYLTVQAAQGKLFAIPIFVSLKEWSDSRLELFDFMVKQFEICQFPEAHSFIELILQQGKAMVLFDGLDEVQQENRQRAEITTKLRDFSRQYLASQCLITCRIAASDYSFEQFTYMEVADFTDKQIKSYAEKWFSGDKLPKQELFFKEFKKPEHKGLRELARTPLLLSLLCLGFEDSLRFPHRRADIYEEALDVLLRKWDSSRAIQRDEIYQGLSLKRKQQLFARVAAETFQQGKYFIEQKFLEQHIETFLCKLPNDDRAGEVDGTVVLKAIEAQHSIFVERAQKIYSFSHLTFQEYFTAKYLAENPKAIKQLMTHCTDKRWREVFLLTASLLDEDNADEFFTEFQRTLVEMVREDESFVKLLVWAKDKAATIQSDDKPAAIRSVYIFLAFAFALDLARALAHALDLDSDFTLELVLVLAHAHALDLPDFLKIDYLLTIALLISEKWEGLDNGDFDDFQEQRYTIPRLIKFLDESVAECQIFPDLYAELRNLTVPNENDRQAVWQAFTKQLRDIMQRHRNIGHEWDLTWEQREKLESYLEANRLLVECLKFALVSDRRAIEDKVLLLSEP